MKKLNLSGARSVLCLVLAASGALGCSSDDEPDSSRAVISTYSEIVLASYEDAVSGARELDEAIGVLVEEPSEANLEAARDAWLAAREPYLQTEVYRFYNGPIDNLDDGPEGLINAWPLDENYIDYVEGDPNAGIINDPSMDIDAESLAALNEAGSEANIATGYHAIEFLLWGQDLSADGPGDRPYTDYVTDGSGTAANQDRRALYLSTVSTQLIANLEFVRDAWAEDETDNYRAEFESVPAREALGRLLSGMIILTGFETGGERLQAALTTAEQEDEHSCFSDNTHRDMIQDIQGIQNVWRGEYRALDGTRISGTGVGDRVREEDPDLADELDARIEESLRLANALEPPFDQEIRNENPEGRARVTELIDSLNVQKDLLEDVFQLFDLTVPEDP